MRARRLDRWFDRFRRRGDVGALARVFDGTAPELYRVAVHLARDLHTAEDLVQATFLAAIEARDAYDARRELLPWLLGILARKAAEERRRARRAVEPGRIEAREAEDPTRTIESVELSAGVERALERMSSPYREVLEAHLKDGRTPVEIALAFGRAPGTVRVQLHRGLEMLRRALPTGLATGGVIAAMGTRGLAAMRGEVVRSGQAVSGSIAAGVATVSTAALLGGIGMNAKAWIVAATVLVGFAWLGAGMRERSSSTAPTEGRRADPPTLDPVATRASGPELAQVDGHADRRPVPSAPEPTAPVETSVSGHLLLPNGTPASGVYVALLRRVEGIPRQTQDERATADDGSFMLRGEPGPGLVVGLAEGLLPVAVPVTLLAQTEVNLEPTSFPAAAHIRGRVRLLGTPAPQGSRVWAVLRAEGTGLRLHEVPLIWSEERLLVQSCLVETEADGRFAIEGLEPRLHQVEVMGTPQVRVLRAMQEVLAPADGIEMEVDCARLVFRIQSEGQPLEAHVTLCENRRGQGSTWGFGSQSSLEVLVPAGSPWEVEVEQEGFSSASTLLVAPGAGETMERVFELTRKTGRAELVIRLDTPDGKTIREAGFGLVGTKSSPGIRSGMVRKGPDGRAPSVIRNVEGQNNTFPLQDIPPDRYQVAVQAEGTWEGGSSYWYHEPLEVELGPEAVEERRIELRLGGRLRIQCSNRRGSPLPAHCEIRDAWGTEIPVTFYTRDERGSVWLGGNLNPSAPRGANDTVPNLPPGRYEVRLSHEGYREASRTVEVAASTTTEVAFVLDDG